MVGVLVGSWPILFVIREEAIQPPRSVDGAPRICITICQSIEVLPVTNIRILPERSHSRGCVDPHTPQRGKSWISDLTHDKKPLCCFGIPNFSER